MLRFAISPTQQFNVGQLRVALFNFILSKQLKQDLMIRMDDTNKQKNIEGEDKKILELLSFFSIDSKGIIYQSENLKYHQKMAMQLMAAKKAFSCFCSDDKLKELQQEAKKQNKPYEYDGFCATLSDETVLNCNAPFTVRIQKPEENITFEDQLQGSQDISVAQVDAFFILDHDKAPTYDYACAIDDMLYNITTVVRSDEFLVNAAKQMHVRAQLGYDQTINYIHVPTLSNPEILLQDLIDDGFLPSAIANYLVVLGNETPTEIFSLEEAIEWFDINKLSSEPAKFDMKKLKYINKKHLESIEEMRLSKILGFADTDIGKLAKLFLQECSTIKQMKDNLSLIFSSKVPLKGLENEFTILKESLNGAPYCDSLEELEAYVEQNTPLKGKTLDTVLQYIISGRNTGPKTSAIYPLIKNYLGEIIK